MKENENAAYLSLTEAAKIVPNRPSANSVWRWCRKGVKSRDGQRIRLQHVRVGGMIFTTPAWLRRFGAELAEADSRYFELAEAAVDAARATEPVRKRRRRACSRIGKRPANDLTDSTDRELDAAGI